MSAGIAQRNGFDTAYLVDGDAGLNGIAHLLAPLSGDNAAVAPSPMAQPLSVEANLAPISNGAVVNAVPPTISLTTSGTAYTQNFNSLSSTAGSTTNALLIDGWAMTESGGGVRDNEQYGVDTGVSSTGDTYSYGVAGQADRALGSLQSGTLISSFGAQFTNSTGATITELTISFTAEQWRIANTAAARDDRLDFQISTDASSLTVGTYTDVNQLDAVNTIKTAATAAALDGNAAANRTAVSYTITNLTIAPGATFWIRWNDFNASGADDGIAIDDFSIIAITGVAAETQTVTFLGPVSQPELDSGTSAFVFTVQRSGGTTGDLTFSGTIAAGGTDGADLVGGTAPTTFSGTILAGQASATVTINVAGDAVVEADETFTLTLDTVGNVAPNVTTAIGATASAIGTIQNDDAVVAQPGQLDIADASVTEGNSGTVAINFTVSRSGGDDGAVGATYDVTFGTADAGDFAAGQVFSGTVAFADGETSKTITLNVAGDTAIETDETFSVTLSVPTGGATLGDAAAAGTITNDDAAPANVFINEFHYDDASTDSDEAIEIAGVAGTNLAGWTIALYNGNGGVVYGTITLSGIIPNQDDGYGTLSFAAPGLQNGSPDGFALVNPMGAVVQFLSYEGTLTATAGPANGMTSTDIGVSEDGSPEGFTLQLTGTGSNYADFTWTAPSAGTLAAVNNGQDFIGPNATGLVSVADVSVVEGNSGTTNLVFTIRRAGGGGQTASVDYTINLTGTANAADLGAGAVLTGTATFNPGDSTFQVIVPIQGDTTGEPNETLTITLSNAIGNISVTDSEATGTILNDDPVAAAIYAIQGESHTSPLVGQTVTTTGIVTAVDTNGYYLQDPTGDGNARTSDGIFVFTNAVAPGVAVGDSVSVTGTVTEFQGSSAGLSLTQLTNPTTSFISAGNPLPAAVLIGTGGILPPNKVIEDDGFTSYDPLTDGLDFYESLEGMRVTIDAPLVTDRTNGFGETQVVASGGAGATGVNARGGITISAGDFNPERIQIDDDSGIFAGYSPNYTQGDRLSSVTGIVNYAFNSYEVLVTAAVTLTQDVTLGEETTSLVGDANHLSIATYNLENLDPGDGKYTLLANDIVYSLAAPDIIAVQEIQDADGAGSGSNLSGTVTAQGLIDAIFALSGKTYAYVEIAPATANSTGGEPGGNIRNGYFYNIDRVSYIVGSAELIFDPSNATSRKPLVAQFGFNGQVITTINVHSTSRGGSDPLFGDTQPPANAGDSSRLAQSNAIKAYINNELATDPSLQFVVLGDFNAFYFEAALTTLTAGGLLTNLLNVLPPEERYSYLFEGNAQALDNILVSGGLLSGARLDAVHINAEQPAGPARPTDHDPQVALIRIVAPTPGATEGPDRLTGTTGNDVLDGLGGDDYFALEQGGNDDVDGGSGNDGFYFGGAFTAADIVDGGAGNNDQIGLQGDYSGGLTLGATTIANIEVIAVLPGFSYNLTLNDANIAAGASLAIHSSQLLADQNLTLDASAETDGTVVVYGGLGTETLTGGAGNDGFYFGPGNFGPNDSVNGGGGTNDQLGLDGDYTITLGGNFTNIEVIALFKGPDSDLNTYNITTNDAAVAAGQQLTIFGTPVVNAFTFNGAAETNGSFRIFGGQGGDTLTGGAGNDIFYGLGGADRMTGGAGSDIFAYTEASESTGINFDQLVDFDYTTDKIDLPGAPVGGFSDAVSGALNTATFDADLAAALNGVLGAGEVAVFQVNAGDFAGRIFGIADLNGVAGYQAGEDLVVEFVTPSPLPTDPTIDFLI